MKQYHEVLSIIQTSKIMQYFTILHYNLLSFNIYAPINVNPVGGGGGGGGSAGKGRGFDA